MKSKLEKQTKREFMIGDIPAVIVDNHKWVLYYWQKYGMEDAVLFHVDSHNDMAGGIPISNELNEEYIQELTYANFILAGFNFDIISTIYWQNPYFKKGQIMFEGGRDSEGDIILELKYNNMFSKKPAVYWKRIAGKNEPNDVPILLEKDFVPKIGLEEKLILDIDLDAFCCCINSDFVKRENINQTGWNRRIMYTMKTLEQMRKPDLITIARSQDVDDRKNRCVSRRYVNRVQKDLLNNLYQLYGGK